VVPVKDGQDTKRDASVNGSYNASAQKYTNPFAMPSTSNPATSAPADSPPLSPPSPTIPLDDGTIESQDAVGAEAEGLTKSQRKKQRKKEKKALAREEAAKEQQLSLGKLAVAT